MNQEFKKALSLGDYEFNAENYEAAHKYYTEAIQLDVDSAIAWRKRAQAAGAIGEVNDCHKAFEKAIELSGDEISDVCCEYNYFRILLASSYVDAVFQNIDSADYSRRELTELNSMDSVAKRLDMECEKVVEFITLVNSGLIDDEYSIPAIRKISKLLSGVNEKLNARSGSNGMFWKSMGKNILHSPIDLIADFIAFKAGISIDANLPNMTLNPSWKAIYSGASRFHGQ